jgi:DNA-binding sugar fermentation-stimulating protein
VYNKWLWSSSIFSRISLDLCITKKKREFKFLISRFDFTGVDQDGCPYILEVKNVPLADYVDVPKKIRKQYKNIENTKQVHEKIAYFPDGYRKNSTQVVSERALKHIHELTEIKKLQIIVLYYVLSFNVQMYLISNHLILI